MPVLAVCERTPQVVVTRKIDAADACVQVPDLVRDNTERSYLLVRTAKQRAPDQPVLQRLRDLEAEILNLRFREEACRFWLEERRLKKLTTARAEYWRTAKTSAREERKDKEREFWLLNIPDPARRQILWNADVAKWKTDLANNLIEAETTWRTNPKNIERRYTLDGSEVTHNSAGKRIAKISI